MVPSNFRLFGSSDNPIGSDDRNGMFHRLLHAGIQGLCSSHFHHLHFGGQFIGGCVHNCLSKFNGAAGRGNHLGSGYRADHIRM